LATVATVIAADLTAEGRIDDDRPCSFLSCCFVSEVRFLGEMVLDAEFSARALIRDSV
jgi:hypothetical protein